MKTIRRSAAVILAAALALHGAAPSSFAQGLESASPEGAQATPPPQAEVQDLGKAAAVAAPAPATAPVEAPVVAPAPAPDDRTRKLVPAKSITALIEPLSSLPVDFDFKDSDLGGILRTFAAKYDKNIILAPGVGGKVSLRLRGVPFDEAFRTMLDQMGLVAVQRSAHVIEIIKASEMPNLVEVFSLKYRFAHEVQATLLAMLKPLEKEKTLISMDGASNSLIITSTSDILHKMKQAVDQLDIESPQIAIKARLIEVQAGNVLNWGLTWSSNSGVKTGTVRTVKDQSNYTLDSAGNILNATTPSGFLSGVNLDFTAVLDRTRLYTLLNILQSDTKTKTISEPTILTGNGKSAKIHVGQNLPVKTSQVTQTATTQSIQYIPEGVDLEVTPVVSPGSDVISFRVRVGISELVGFQDNNPITTERTATTEVSVESGKTVVIGGLIKEKTIDTESGVPFLKDIPILGYLFKTKRKSKDKTELLIFITPEIVPMRARS